MAKNGVYGSTWWPMISRLWRARSLRRPRTRAATRPANPPKAGIAPKETRKQEYEDQQLHRESVRNRRGRILRLDVRSSAGKRYRASEQMIQNAVNHSCSGINRIVDVVIQRGHGPRRSIVILPRHPCRARKPLRRRSPTGRNRPAKRPPRLAGKLVNIAYEAAPNNA